MALEIKTKILKTFVDKTMMTKGQQLKEYIMRFEKEGLKINANSESKQARVMAWLKKEAFKTYEELGNVGINDLENVSKVLDRFGEDISLSKEGNLLTIKGQGKKVDIELVSENFLDTDTGEPSLEFVDTFAISATKLKELYKDVQMNKDATITFETAEKKVKVSNTGKYKFLTELDADTCKGGAKTTFGDPLIDATINLTGNLEISLANNYPVKIIEKVENESVITFIVAPRVEEE